MLIMIFILAFLVLVFRDKDICRSWYDLSHPDIWIGNHDIAINLLSSTAKNFLKNLLAIGFKNLTYLEDASKSPFRDLHFRIPILAVGICFSPRFELSVTRNLQTHFYPVKLIPKRRSLYRYHRIDSVKKFWLSSGLDLIYLSVLTCWTCPSIIQLNQTLNINDIQHKNYSKWVYSYKH